MRLSERPPEDETDTLLKGGVQAVIKAESMRNLLGTQRASWSTAYVVSNQNSCPQVLKIAGLPLPPTHCLMCSLPAIRGVMTHVHVTIATNVVTSCFGRLGTHNYNVCNDHFSLSIRSCVRKLESLQADSCCSSLRCSHSALNHSGEHCRRWTLPLIS